jgi:F-type H+-transporting ATPase subunit a
MANIPEISVPPHQTLHLGHTAISDAMLGSILVFFLLLAFLLYHRSKMSIVPGRLQVAMEGLIGFFYKGLTDAYGSDKLARIHLPIIVGFFLFIFFCNQLVLVPFVQSIVNDEGHFLFRAPTSHFSLTLALALIMSFTMHVSALMINARHHLGHFCKLGLFLKVRSVTDFLDAILQNFLALLEIIGEFAKIISLSARLFGNIFAGEVMVFVITGISVYSQFIVPSPFYFLTLFAGTIQALVFSMLAMSFISGASRNAM